MCYALRREHRLTNICPLTVLLSTSFNKLPFCSPIKNLDLSEEKMDIVEEKFKESMSGDNRGPNEVLAGSESNKDSKENCNPINEVESVVKLEKKSSKKGFFAPFKPPQKLVSFEF